MLNLDNASNEKLKAVGALCRIPKTLESIGKKPLSLWVEDFRRPSNIFWVIAASEWASTFDKQITFSSMAIAYGSKRITNFKDSIFGELMSRANFYATQQAPLDHVMEVVEEARNEREFIDHSGVKAAAGMVISAALYTVTRDPDHAANIAEYAVLSVTKNGAKISLEKEFKDRIKWRK